MAGEGLSSCSVAELGIPGDRGWAVRDEAAGEIRNGRKLPELLLCSARYLSEPGEDEIPPVEILLPDGSLVRSDAREASDVLSRLLGREVTIWPRRPADDLDHYRRGRPDHADPEKEIRQIMNRLPDEPLPDFSLYSREMAGFTCPPGTYFDAFPLHLLTTASLAWLEELQPGADGDPRRFRPNVVIETEGDTRGPVEANWCGRELRIGETRLAVEIPTVRCAIPGRAHAGLPADRTLLRTIVREFEQNLGVYASTRATGRISVGDRVELL